MMEKHYFKKKDERENIKGSNNFYLIKMTPPLEKD